MWCECVARDDGVSNPFEMWYFDSWEWCSVGLSQPQLATPNNHILPKGYEEERKYKRATTYFKQVYIMDGSK